MLTRSKEFVELVEVARSGKEVSKDPTFLQLVGFVREFSRDIDTVVRFFREAERCLAEQSPGTQSVFDILVLFDKPMGIVMQFKPSGMRKMVRSQEVASRSPGSIILYLVACQNNGDQPATAAEMRHLTSEEAIKDAANESVKRFCRGIAQMRA
ncbi:MAG: hypothetical protein ABIO72_02250 [Patescibacteria group bacterium]